MGVTVVPNRWSPYLVQVIPYAVLIVFLIQALSSVKLFDISLYNTTSVELLPARIATEIEYIFAINVFISLLSQLVSVPFLFKNRKTGWYLLIISTLATTFNTVISVSLFGLITNILLYIILLQISKEYH